MADPATSRRGQPYCIYPRPSYTHSEIYHSITSHRPSISSLYSNYNYNSDSQSVVSLGGGGGGAGGGAAAAGVKGSLSMGALPRRTKSGKIAWRGAVAKITARAVHPPASMVTPRKIPRLGRRDLRAAQLAQMAPRIGGGGWKLPNAYPFTRGNSKQNLKSSSTPSTSQSESASTSFEKTS